MVMHVNTSDDNSPKHSLVLEYASLVVVDVVEGEEGPELKFTAIEGFEPPEIEMAGSAPAAE